MGVILDLVLAVSNWYYFHEKNDKLSFFFVFQDKKYLWIPIHWLQYYLVFSVKFKISIWTSPIFLRHFSYLLLQKICLKYVMAPGRIVSIQSRIKYNLQKCKTPIPSVHNFLSQTVKVIKISWKFCWNWYQIQNCNTPILPSLHDFLCSTELRCQHHQKHWDDDL